MNLKFIRTIKSLVVGISFLIFLSSLAPTVSAAEKLNTVIAIVNEDVITKAELNTKYKILLTRIQDTAALPPEEQLKKQLLSKLIIDKLQLQLAKSRDINVSAKEINNVITNVAKEQELTLSQFKEKLDLEGISYLDYRRNIEEQLIVADLQQKEVGMDTNVTDSEVDSFLNSPLGQDLTGTEYRLGHILLTFPEKNSEKARKELKKKAKDIVQLLRNGADFGKIAMKESSGSNALEGGDLGWRTVGKIPTLFANDVVNLSINDVVGPIKSSSGYHIIKLKQKRIGHDDLHTEYKARHILVKIDPKVSDKDAKDKLDKIRTQIINGKDFKKLAQKNSDELSTNYKGGDLGWFNKDKVLPDFYSKVSKLQVDEVSKPFKTKLGWHLVQLIGKRSNSNSIIAARNRARGILHERKFNQRLELWLKRLHANARVKNYLDRS